MSDVDIVGKSVDLCIDGKVVATGIVSRIETDAPVYESADSPDKGYSQAPFEARLEMKITSASTLVVFATREDAEKFSRQKITPHIEEQS